MQVPCRLRPLILASASPRRRELLQQAGIEFEVVTCPAAEPAVEAGESPSAFAVRAAEAKALSVARRHPGRWVLGADTVVALDGQVLGKPRDATEAATMLRRLSGRTHQVHTGVALVCAPEDGRVVRRCEVVTTSVTFCDLDEAQIAAYVASGEPLDKAGAYGIQGAGRALVSEYRGSYSNVVGLPMETLTQMLQALDTH